MAWQKGQSGNPSGKSKTKGRPMSGTTMIDIFEGILAGRQKEYPSTPKKQTCLKLLSAMRNGEPWAIREILHMTMGMPIAKTVLTGSDEGPVRLIIQGAGDGNRADGINGGPGGSDKGLDETNEGGE